MAPNSYTAQDEKRHEETEMAKILDEQWRNPKLGRGRKGSPFLDKVRQRHADEDRSSATDSRYQGVK